MTQTLGVIGVPTSAAAFAPGQELAPAALRDAGLLARLSAHGFEVRDHGDRKVWRWRPDRGQRRAQNAGKVAEIVRETAQRVADAAAAGEVTLVLGGDCTVGIGTVAGHLQAAPDERVGLLYFDSHADLNVPASVPEGALDWMGMAHMLGEEGAVTEVVEAGPRVPLLEPDQVLVFAWGPGSATAFERDVLRRRELRVISVDQVAADPVRAATEAREEVERRCDRLLVHFDVDVIDFTDVPLSENWGRNEGLPYEAAMRALGAILASPKLAALTITELNPVHAEAGAGSVERFVGDVASGLSGSPGQPPRPDELMAAEESVPIRRATDGDAEAAGLLLHDFNREFDEPTPSPRALAARVRALLKGGDTAVLLAGVEPCGLAVLRFRLGIWTTALECYLAELYVIPAHRGQGIGRALMEASMELARSEGADYMDLGTGEDDVAARALYESLGFSNRGGKPDGPINYFYERDL